MNSYPPFSHFFVQVRYYWTQFMWEWSIVTGRCWISISTFGKAAAHAWAILKISKMMMMTSVVKEQLCFEHVWVSVMICWHFCRSSTEADEAVLCTLKVHCNGVLSIKPDFNKGCRAYKVGGGLSGKGTCIFVPIYGTILLLLFWHAELGVHSSTRR